MYPLVDEKKQDPLEEAKQQHEAFMRLASERVVGREDLINQVRHFQLNTNQPCGYSRVNVNRYKISI